MAGRPCGFESHSPYHVSRHEEAPGEPGALLVPWWLVVSRELERIKDRSRNTTCLPQPHHSLLHHRQYRSWLGWHYFVKGVRLVSLVAERWTTHEARPHPNAPQVDAIGNGL